MHWLKNLKLTPKLMLAFGVVLVLLAAQGVGAYYGLSSLNRATTNLSQGSMQSVSVAAELRALLGEYRTAAYRGLVRASEAVKLDARERSAKLSEQIDQSLAAYGKLAATAEERKLLEELRRVTLDTITVDEFDVHELRAASYYDLPGAKREAA